MSEAVWWAALASREFVRKAFGSISFIVAVFDSDAKQALAVALSLCAANSQDFAHLAQVARIVIEKRRQDVSRFVPKISGSLSSAPSESRLVGFLRWQIFTFG